MRLECREKASFEIRIDVERVASGTWSAAQFSDESDARPSYGRDFVAIGPRRRCPGVML